MHDKRCCSPMQSESIAVTFASVLENPSRWAAPSDLPMSSSNKFWKLRRDQCVVAHKHTTLGMSFLNGNAWFLHTSKRTGVFFLDSAANCMKFLPLNLPSRLTAAAFILLSNFSFRLKRNLKKREKKFNSSFCENRTRFLTSTRTERCVTHRCECGSCSADKNTKHWWSDVRKGQDVQM